MNSIERINNYFIINNNKEVVIKEEILKTISSFINESRYKHCLSVGKLSYDIAISNNLDNPLIYYFVGLVHDIAKDLDKDSEVINKYLSKEEKQYPRYMHHQFLGYYLVKELFKIDDEYILNGIKYHCSGRSKMTTLEKIIYASDKIDPLRGYDSSFMIKKMKEDYGSGFLIVLTENKKFIDNKELKYNENSLTKECYRYYL